MDFRQYTVKNNKQGDKKIPEVSRLFTQKGLRQGDSLACLLFNLALEKVVRNAGMQTSGTIFYKSVQLLAYADDRYNSENPDGIKGSLSIT